MFEQKHDQVDRHDSMTKRTHGQIETCTNRDTQPETFQYKPKSTIICSISDVQRGPCVKQIQVSKTLQKEKTHF